MVVALAVLARLCSAWSCLLNLRCQSTPRDEHQPRFASAVAPFAAGLVALLSLRQSASVAENNLRLELARADPFYAALRADRHERRRFNHAVRGR